MTTPSSDPIGVSGLPLVRLYWRPGCGFCMMLRFRLHRQHLAMEEVNIWEDPDAAAFVRSVAGGNETVPTVVVGDRVFVNPSPREVIGAVVEAIEAGGH